MKNQNFPERHKNGPKTLIRFLMPGRGATNMKSLRLPLAAIFFMTNFYRTGGPWPPWPPWIRYWVFPGWWYADPQEGKPPHRRKTTTPPRNKTTPPPKK